MGILGITGILDDAGILGYEVILGGTFIHIVHTHVP